MNGQIEEQVGEIGRDSTGRSSDAADPDVEEDAVLPASHKLGVYSYLPPHNYT